MISEDAIRTELEAVEPNDVAARDAADLADRANDPTHMNEQLIRIRLYAIEREQGLGASVLNPVWALVGFEKAPPTWIPTP